MSNQSHAPRISFNLAPAVPWSRGRCLMNQAKLGSTWIVHLNGGWGGADHSHLAAAGLLDADGYPTSMPSVLNGGNVDGISTLILWDEHRDSTSHAGTYLLEYE